MRDEGGFMLIELLVVTAVLIVVVGATLALLDTGTRAENRDQEYAAEVAAAQVGLARMTREIRQASSVTSANPNSIDFFVTLGGQALHVFYECDFPNVGTAYNECLRTSVAAGGSLPAPSTGAPVIPRILNGTVADPVFSYAPNSISPTYADVKLKLPAAGELKSGGLSHSTVLDSGGYLRNLDVGA
ncbi:MAG: hypothetical protein NVSMB51_13540 [Solirubrobacteraceae bacterium]